MKKILNKIITNYNYIIILLIIILSFILNLSKIIQNINIFKYYIVILFLIAILLILVNYLFKKGLFAKKIENIFLILGITLGIFYIFLSPLFTGSDEHNHYYRIYEIVSGKIKTETNFDEKFVGSKLPASLEKTYIRGGGYNWIIKYKNIKDMASVALEKNEITQYGVKGTNNYSNTALYSPVSYAPHILGFLIGKLLNLNPYYIGVLGRITNLVFYLLFGYLSIKILNNYKLFYLLILLSPNMMQCATTLSADAFTNVIILLFISIISYIISSKYKMDTLSKILIFLLSCIIALCKIVYLPLVLLLLVIDNNKFSSKKDKYIFIFITLIVSMILNLMWLNNTNDIFAIEYYNNALQKQYILNNIFKYILVILRTYYYHSIKYLLCLFVGTTMYHSQLIMPTFISIMYVLLVILSLFTSDNKNKLSKFSKFIVFLIQLVIIGLLSTALYIQFTAQYYMIGDKVIEGLQGRYFIPIVFLLPLIISTKKLNINSKDLIKYAVCINFVTFIFMISLFIA